MIEYQQTNVGERMKPVTIKAAIYARFSSEQQDNATIETQIAECMRKIESLNGIVVKVYRDEAKSGRVEDRPDFQLMVREAIHKSRPFDMVVVRKFDRFARDVAISRQYKVILRKAGVKVISVHEELDSETAAGNFMETILEGLSEFYSRNLAVETKSGQETNTKRGYRCGGNAPLGYKNVKKTDPETLKVRTVLEIDENEAPIIRLVFRRYAAGIGMKTIINELYKMGYQPRKAKGWAANSMSSILHNETYSGTLVWRKNKNPDSWIKVPGKVPALIDEETWEQVQKRLERNKVTMKPRSVTQSKHPLAGMIVCDKCGGSFVIGSNPNNRGWYLVCRNHRDTRKCANARHIKEAHLIDAIKDVLSEKVLTTANVKKALEQYKRELDQSAASAVAEMSKKQRELDLIEKHESQMMDELILQDLPRESVKRKLKDLNEARERVLASVETLNREISKKSNLIVSDADVKASVCMLHARLMNSEEQQLKELLETLHLHVRVCENQLKIETASELIRGCPNGTNAGSGT